MKDKLTFGFHNNDLSSLKAEADTIFELLLARQEVMVS